MLIKSIILLLLFISSIICDGIIDVLSKDKRFEVLLQHIQHFELVTFVNDIKSGTLFAPDNDAFQRYENEIDRATLIYHFLKKTILLNEVYHGEIRETFYSRPGYLGPNDSGQRIKFTIKNNNKIFVNNAKITSDPIQADNQTFIYTIDRVLEPPKLLGDTIIANYKDKAIFQLMNSTDIITNILKENKPFTIFLTTNNDPLNKFKPIESTYLNSQYGKEDLSTFFKYTIIDKAIFIDEFNAGKTTYKSLTGDSLVIATDKDKVTINDIPIKSTDIIAANGVIHEIEDTFDSNVIKFNTRKYLYGLDAAHFVELVDKFGSSHYIDQHQYNYTFLIPPKNVIDNKSWLKYHILAGSWPQEILIDNMLLCSEFKPVGLDSEPQKVPVYVEKEKIMITSQSIQFDKSRVIGDYVNIHDDIIYQISEPLTLPGDILEKLVLDLDLSTFIATLYVSDVMNEIKDTKGLTLFAPTNQAFKNMGLVAKYLVHPSAKTQLQTVLRYHAARSLLYYDDMKQNLHEVFTLANSTLRVSQNEAGSIIVSTPEGKNPATVSNTNTLVSNGVIHKISEVQIPTEIEITNQNILVGIESTIMMQILTKANLLDKINEKDIVVLTPTDKAFARVDIESLMNDPYQLERLAKLHIIPSAWQDRWIENNSHKDKIEYPTLLSDDDKVTIRENEKGELSVIVNNGGDNNQAHVIGLGRVSAGGGVISIDNVLIPIHRGLFGLPFVWSIVVILVIIMIVGGILSVVGFFTYKIYNRRRLGYRPIY